MVLDVKFKWVVQLSKDYQVSTRLWQFQTKTFKHDWTNAKYVSINVNFFHIKKLRVILVICYRLERKKKKQLAFS